MRHFTSGLFLKAFSSLLLFFITIFQINSQWSLQFSGTNYPLHTVYFLNNSTGLLASNSNLFPQLYGGEIIRTTNGGDNWQRVLLDSNFRAKGFYFFDANTGYSVGGSYATQGYIYKSTNGGAPIGIEPISSEIPNQFVLHQNYPNPFNPTTKIKFDIPPSKGASGMITRLAIYDALGREVAVLVNEQLSPGTYEVIWDASSYPSGVYFYKLIAQGYSETKKMVLVK